MRILGIDHGHKRLGLAVSDPLGIAAHGLPTLERKSEEEDMAALRRIIEEKEVEEIVVGLPKQMNGSIGTEAKVVLQFAEKLRRICELPLHLVDERLTTKMVEREMIQRDLSRRARKRRLDRAAAQVILQSFLNSRQRQKENGKSDVSGSDPD